MSEIVIKDLHKSYGKNEVLHGINLKFEEGKIYGLLGRNGAGKSTLLNIISNRIYATSGSITIDGEDSKENDNALSKIYCMSETNLYPVGMKIKKLFDEMQFFYPEFDKEYALDLCKKFSVDIRKKLGSLSTGYGSIYKLIVALACNAPIVFFDEPVLGLDATHREMFYKLMLEKYSETGQTFVISTHLIEQAANLIERVVIIHDGKILTDCDTEDFVSGYYTITGNTESVREYAKNNGLEVVGEEGLSSIITLYIKGKRPKFIEGFEVEKCDLQKLFVRLTY